MHVKIDRSHPEVQAELKARRAYSRWVYWRALALECAGYLAALAVAVWWLR